MKPTRSSLLHPRRRAAVPPPPQPVTDAIKETCSFIRAHSSIRFIALPFFLGAIAVLVKTFYDPGDISRSAVALAGLGLSSCALIVEVVLSRNLIAWWAAIDRLIETEPTWAVVRSHRDPRALNAVRWALFVPYVAAFTFWLHKVARLALPAPAGIPDSQHRLVLAVLALAAGCAVCRAAWSTWERAQVPKN